MWWSAIDESLRKLQPFVAMANRPLDPKYGAGLSYESTQWISAAYTALRRKHWLPASITFGNIHCQICKVLALRSVLLQAKVKLVTISISALFQRADGTFMQPIRVQRHVDATTSARL